ncbi:MAG: cobalamin-dependent protein [Nitrospiraceae bacterium]|nr:cobalamin-dependent protein [Nitrospiraceae bacterium]
MKQMQRLIDALLDGDRQQALDEARRLVSEGATPDSIVINAIEPAMNRLDAKCTVEQFNLLEIMLVGRCLTAVVNEIFPQGMTASLTKGCVVIATLEGDVHDIGKNITKMLLASKGYNVVDCGKDCSVQKLCDTAEAQKADAVFVSGLITSVIPNVKKIKEELETKGLGCIMVVAGGAALKQSTSDHLNVDFVAENAFEGLHYLESKIGARNN